LHFRDKDDIIINTDLIRDVEPGDGSASQGMVLGFDDGHEG
jgi:hypothetical protein